MRSFWFGDTNNTNNYRPMPLVKANNIEIILLDLLIPYPDKTDSLDLRTHTRT